MKSYTPLVLAALLLTSLPPAPLQAQGPTQQPTPAPPTAATPQQPQPTPSPRRFGRRSGAHHVEPRAVRCRVVDKQGQQVTDLRAENFEVTLEGDKQQLTNFSYISNVPGPAEARTVVAARPADKNAPPVPPARLRPDRCDALSRSSWTTRHFFREHALRAQALKNTLTSRCSPTISSPSSAPAPGWRAPAVHLRPTAALRRHRARALVSGRALGRERLRAARKPAAARHADAGGRGVRRG